MLAITLEFNDNIGACRILETVTVLPQNLHETVLCHYINSEIIFSLSTVVSPPTGKQLL